MNHYKIIGLSFFLIISVLFSQELIAKLTLNSHQLKTIESSKIINGIILNDIKNSEFNFINAQSDTFSIQEIDDPFEPLVSKTKSLIGKSFNFPNPVKQGKDTQIGYKLSESMAIDIYIYDTEGNLLLQRHFEKGINGGDSKNYNKIGLREHGFLTETLPVGIYFYIIAHNQDVLGKGKIAVIP